MGSFLQTQVKQLRTYHVVGMVILLCFSPLIGVLYLDLPFGWYLEFPPRTKYIVHAPFSWWAFLFLFLFIVAVCFPFLYRLITYSSNQGWSCEEQYPFPWWGWLGFCCIIVSWILAWNRFPFFESWQRYTFTPLWLGYILFINGLTYRRIGSCLLCSQTRFFLLLFPVSTLFWWYFEYLNRFVQNWYYICGGEISAVEYVVHATICFSTVLPAVISTSEFLYTLPRLSGAFSGWYHVKIEPGRKAGWIILTVAAGSLASLVIFADYLFPLVWISPLFMIVGIQLIAGNRTIFADLEKGDWRNVIIPSLAALLCGFFWEMWNWKSFAHWEYSVPFVHRFQIFAMPLLGYAGYLPFGLECIILGSLLRPEE